MVCVCVGGGGGGCLGAPTAINQFWGGPSLQKVENPCSNASTAILLQLSFCFPDCHYTFPAITYRFRFKYLPISESDIP